MVLLVRHATTDHVGRILTGRTGGVGLSAIGRAEATALAARLSRMPLDAIGSSPRERARETAATIAAHRTLDVESVEDIDEIDFGAFAGRSFADLDGDPDWRTWNEDRAGARAPGGETMAEVSVRVRRALARAAETACGGTLALVSHADVIKTAVIAVLGLGFDALPRFEVSPASVTRIAIDRGMQRLLSLNGRE